MPRVGITDGLRARNVQVITAQDDGHREADDEILLARATALNCVLFSRDEDLLEICSAGSEAEGCSPGWFLPSR